MVDQKTRKPSLKPPFQMATQIKKVATGISGLDDILNGGLPSGQTTLIRGSSGTGKTILGLEFLLNGAKEGNPGIFISFEERSEIMRKNALSQGWDISHFEKQGMIFLMDARLNPDAILSGDFSLKSFFAIVEGKAKQMKATRFVLDAIEIFLNIYNDPKRERDELYAVENWFKERGMTVVLTAKDSQSRELAAQNEFLDYLSDCVIHVGQRVLDQIATRRIRIMKYRGSGYGSNEYPFAITDSGVRIIPITTTGIQHQPSSKRLSSGNRRLDEITGGGYPSGACLLIAGTSGTGKTTLACTFVLEASNRGEKTIYIDFEQSAESLVLFMCSPGIDLRPALKSGALMHLSAIPEAFGAEVHLINAFAAMESFKPQHVVIDAISACKRMGTEQTAFEYVMRISTACKERGITLLVINQNKGFLELGEISGIGISSLVDTLIFLRHIDIRNEISRVLLVVKARGTQHSNKYHEYIISDKGIDLADTYFGQHGMLTHTAMLGQDDEAEQQEIRRLEMKILRQEQALNAKLNAAQVEIDAEKIRLKAMKLSLQNANRYRARHVNLQEEKADINKISKPKFMQAARKSSGKEES